MKKTLVLFAFIVLSQVSKAQQGFGTNNPDPSTVIDMVGSTKGVLMPRVALSSLIVAAPVVSPADALTVFNTATAGSGANAVTPGYYYWSMLQMKWVRLLDANASINNWRVEETTTPATLNTQNIYQNGNVGIGDFSGSKPLTRLDVRGGMRGGVPHPDELSGTSPIGLNSVAIGDQNIASQEASTAIGGGYNQATGYNSTIIGGDNNVASNHTAVVLASSGSTASNAQALVIGGNQNEASGRQSIVIGGSGNIASGSNSTIIGLNNTAPSFGETALGMYGTDYTPLNKLSANPADRLFNVGSGAGAAVLADAFTILKNGRTGIGFNNFEAVTFTEKLQVNGNARLTGLPSITGSLSTDKIVVADANGVLKTVAASVISSTEPWQVQTSTTKATANTENIYQQGKVAVGFTSADATTAKQMEVKGDFKASRISSGGNTMALEVNTPYGPETTGAYWLTPSSQIHAFVVDPQNARAIALDNLASPTKSSNFEVGLNAVNIYSKHPDNAKQAALELSAINSQFALYANQYSTNVGSMVKSDGVNGLLLYNAGSSAATSVVDGNDRTQVTIKKGEGVTFSHFNAASALTGNYTFPTTSGTNGQVMTKSTGNNIVWGNGAALALANNGLTKNVTTNEIELGGTLNKVTSIATSGTNTLSITGLPTGATTDNILLSSTGGQLKTITTDNLVQEPWNVQGGTTKATTNAQNIYQTGNVAIGATTIPSITVGTSTINPKFHVNGDISTTGKIYTTNSVYADYVFEKYFAGKSEINPNYEFKSLDYVRNFIKANNHLPGVQSINDLTKANNGYTFDMTKLTIQSLEKIEELYIHTIEQKDKIDAQQAEIEKLKKEAEDTKARLARLEKLLIKN